MPGAPRGPALRNTSTSSARHVERRDRRCARSGPRTESNTTARPVCCSSAGVAADCLMIAPRGARLPRSTAMLPHALDRIGARADHVLARHVLGRRDVVARACRRMTVARVEVEESGELAQQARHAAGPVEVLHVVPARRLQVDQHRHLAAELDRTRRDRSRCRGGPAAAVRCTRPLVEPPIACRTTIALRKAAARHDLRSAAVRR